jgi:hypothetical protein
MFISFPCIQFLSYCSVSIYVISNSTLSHSIHLTHLDSALLTNLSHPFIPYLFLIWERLLLSETVFYHVSGHTFLYSSVLVVGYSSVFESQVISSPLFDQY